MVSARFPASIVLLLLTGASFAGQLSTREEMVMQTSTAVLNEIMAVPLRSIPASLLTKAQGVAIFPNVIKGGFIVGARHGSGVLLVRDETGAWHAPVFATITGGNIGFQAGLQATDVVLVFVSRQSVQRFLSGKFSVGVDAAAAAGPVGRQASAATDAELKAEIYSYSRSRGLFAGVSLDGSIIQIDSFANAAYYHRSPQGQTYVPRSAATLVAQVTAYAGGGTYGLAPQPQPRLAIVGKSEADHLRDQLRHTAPELYERLDAQWSAYLTLPAAVFTGQGHPPPQELRGAIARFNQIAADPRYRVLSQSPQFQSTYGLLKHYQSTLEQPQTPFQLPPPPVSSESGVRDRQ